MTLISGKYEGANVNLRQFLVCTSTDVCKVVLLCSFHLYRLRLIPLVQCKYENRSLED